ncbi:MAG: hypothetical protein PHH03_01335 [Eubacteriales bacterium]|nr:hypothetical protein [Eubacteriales bacterium]
MRKQITIMLLALMMAVPTAGISEEGISFRFDEIRGAVALPTGVYDTVLTPDTFKANEAFIHALGGTVENYEITFSTNGILLKAFDSDNGRILTLSALKTDDSKQYFNINEHTPEARASYRRSHSTGDSYSVLGYYYNSVEWKNFRDVGRWLMLRYDFRQEGEVVSRGYQRRTVFNGYTITFDMEVPGGRPLKGGDNTALNKVFDSFRFTTVLPLPDLPVTFNEKVTAPSETSEPTFTMTGSTEPGATLTAVVGSFSTAKTQVIESVAKNNGNYSITITLPQEDLYFMTLTVRKEGAVTLDKQYAITYRKGLLPISITAVPPEILIEDSYRVTGTSPRGTQVQLDVNGSTTGKKVGANEAFTFTVDTSSEGEYDLKLTLSKAGFETRSFSYKSTRTYSHEERVQKIRDSSTSPAYANLIKNVDRYDGEMLRYEGYLMSQEERAGEYIMLLALNKNGDTYTDNVILTGDQQSGFPPSTLVRVYGVLIGTNTMLNEEQKEIEYPKLQIRHIESVAAQN